MDDNDNFDYWIKISFKSFHYKKLFEVFEIQYKDESYISEMQLND